MTLNLPVGQSLGESIRLAADPGTLHYFDAQTGNRVDG